MTLLQLIEALKSQNVKVTVIDADSDNELITFFSQGIGGVESDVSGRTVKRWLLNGAQSISVYLEAEV